jgi:hypothetical protein
MRAFLATCVASFLPEGRRRRSQAFARDLGPAATLVTGLAQLAAGLTLGILWFLDYRLQFYRRSVDAGFPGGDLGVMFGYGGIMYLSYFLTVPALLAGYLFLEGGVRSLAVVITGETCGSLVVWAACVAGDAWRRRGARREARTRRPDTMTERDDGCLVLDSDLGRDWDALTTIGHEDKLYRVRGSGPEASPARRYRYTLEPIPASHLVRAITPLVVDVIGRG